jgi:hypothetical protein
MSPVYSIVERERAELLALRTLLLKVVSTLDQLSPGTVASVREQIAKGLVKSIDESALTAKDALVRDRMTAFLDDLKTP